MLDTSGFTSVVMRLSSPTRGVMLRRTPTSIFSSCTVCSAPPPDWPCSDVMTTGTVWPAKISAGSPSRVTTFEFASSLPLPSVSSASTAASQDICCRNIWPRSPVLMNSTVSGILPGAVGSGLPSVKTVLHLVSLLQSTPSSSRRVVLTSMRRASSMTWMGLTSSAFTTRAASARAAALPRTRTRLPRTSARMLDEMASRAPRTSSALAQDSSKTCESCMPPLARRSPSATRIELPTRS